MSAYGSAENAQYNTSGGIMVDHVVPYQGTGEHPALVPPYNHTVVLHQATVLPSDGVGDTTSHILAYVLVPLGAIILIAVLSFLVVFILKKSRLDKLRHHLMPLYNFDPGEEEGDWESELLEEEKEQQVALQIRMYDALPDKSPSPVDGQKLKFTTEHMEV